MNVSIVIPVYNEKGRLESVLDRLRTYPEVIVIDDGSDVAISDYIDASEFENLTLFRNDRNLGYLASIRRGIAAARQDIIITMDGDGEHKPEDIPKMLAHMQRHDCDIVFGKRPNIARPSERFLLQTARILTHDPVKDSGTGFRVMKAALAKRFEFPGRCTCGMLLMECHQYQAKTCEIEVDLPRVDKVRRVAWEHIPQFYFVLKYYFLKLVFNNK